MVDLTVELLSDILCSLSVVSSICCSPTAAVILSSSRPIVEFRSPITAQLHALHHIYNPTNSPLNPQPCLLPTSSRLFSSITNTSLNISPSTTSLTGT